MPHVVTARRGRRLTLLEATLRLPRASCRTPTARVVRSALGRGLELDASATASAPNTVGVEPGQPKRLQVDGATVYRLYRRGRAPPPSSSAPTARARAGALRCVRAHVDHVISRVARPALALAAPLGRALPAPRLLSRSAPAARPQLVPAWTPSSAPCVCAAADRASVVARLRSRSRLTPRSWARRRRRATYRPRSRASTADAPGPSARAPGSDLERGFTGHGRIANELFFKRAAASCHLRVAASSSSALLSLLLADRGVLRRSAGPLRDAARRLTSELDSPPRAAVGR